MSSLDTNNTLQNLIKKGFVQNNKDHKFLEFWHEGKMVLYTKISHGSSKDIHSGLISKMARQCLLSNHQFIDLAKCPMKQEEYIEILASKDSL
jgi:hypothetical protein